MEYEFIYGMLSQNVLYSICAVMFMLCCGVWLVEQFAKGIKKLVHMENDILQAVDKDEMKD